MTNFIPRLAKKRAKRLRKRGYTYDKIGEKIGASVTTARKLVLGGRQNEVLQK